MPSLPPPELPALPSAPRPVERPSVVAQVDSRDLLAGRSAIEIRHGSETYRLCQTRQGKLILTK